jgi:hypothetical protein
MSRQLAIALLAAAALPGAAALEAQPVDTLAIRGHTRFLADDLLRGRATGTEGERLAAAYIASQAERIGLHYAGAATSFLHPLPLRRAVIDTASHLVLYTGRDSTRFHHGRHFIVETGGRGAIRDFRGRALFLGQPAHAATLIARARSLVGYVAVFAGPLGAHAVDIVPALSHAGAAGIVLLAPDTAHYELLVRSRGTARYLADTDVDDPVWQPPLPVLTAGPALTHALLDGVTLTTAIFDGTAERGTELGRTIAARIAADVQPLASASIAAVLPGSDPYMRDRYVAYTAHYDHLGTGPPDAAGDSIYNGFSDNAAGVAMLLAIAERLAADPPPHSTLFLFLSGEERGLLGASCMAAHPPVPLEDIIALINLDAGAPPAPPVSWHIAGGATALDDAAVRVATRHGWSAAVTPATPNTDHWPFLQRGVPAIFIIPGTAWEGVTAAGRDTLRQRWDRYHQPGDEWHPEFPFAGLGRYADFALLVGLEAGTTLAATRASPARPGRPALHQ